MLGQVTNVQDGEARIGYGLDVMKLRNLLLLVSLGAIWGASYIFIRLAAPSFGNLWLIAVRLLIAGVTLLMLIPLTGGRPAFRNRWWHYVILGTINAGIPFTLITSAVTTMNVSTSAILTAIPPASTAVEAACSVKDSLSPLKLAGLLLGMCGGVVLVGWNPLPLSRQTILAALQAIVATVLYGFGTVYVRVRFKDDTPLA